jgi:large conductance mechanosensitive channel
MLKRAAGGPADPERQVSGALAGNLRAMSGFKNFVMRGNLVQLAVAVVIGTQFSNLVQQFVRSFINPLLALAGHNPDFANLSFTVNKAKFTYGAFLTDVLSFLISAMVVYFVLVVPVTRLIQLFERNQAATSRDCPECTMSIPVAARRCPECTAEIIPATEQPQRVNA